MKSGEENVFFDPWEQITLAPGLHGEHCRGNGSHPEVECCCDACDFFLICYPEREDS